MNRSLGRERQRQFVACPHFPPANVLSLCVPSVGDTLPLPLLARISPGNLVSRIRRTSRVREQSNFFDSSLASLPLTRLSDLLDFAACTYQLPSSPSFIPRSFASSSSRRRNLVPISPLPRRTHAVCTELLKIRWNKLLAVQLLAGEGRILDELSRPE